MFSLTQIQPSSLMPAAETAGHAVCDTTPEAFLASLITHIRNKNLSDAQCVSAIRETISRFAAG